MTTTRYAPRTVTIANGRPHAAGFGLDSSGFTLLEHGSAVTGADEAGSVFEYRPGHRWWYFPSMRADEALLFKLHDTDHSAAWRAPHTAFHDVSAAGGNFVPRLRTRFSVFCSL